MSEKKYVANNTKYYKDSNSSEIDHVIRAMKENVNAFEDLTKNNFGHTFDNETLNLKQNYQLKLSEAKVQNKYAIQKNSNTFIDSVLAFDNKLMFEILETEDGQDRVNESIKNYMNDFKKNYGFEPIGFQFHTDEGTFYNKKQFENLDDEDLKKRLVPTKNDKGEDGYLKQNFHAQAIFLNFDKKTGKSCLRNMNKKQDWADVQDLLHKHFEEYGFDRGEPKQTSDQDHKSKSDYVKDLKEQTKYFEQKEKDLLLKVKEKSTQLLDIYDEMDGIEEDSIRFNDIRTKVIDTVKSVVRQPKIFSFIKKSYEKLSKTKTFSKIEDLKNFVIDKFEITDEEIGLGQKKDVKIEQPKVEEPKKEVEEIKPIIEDLSNDDLKKEIEDIEEEVQAKAKKITKSQAKNARKNRIK